MPYQKCIPQRAAVQPGQDPSEKTLVLTTGRPAPLYTARVFAKVDLLNAVVCFFF